MKTFKEKLLNHCKATLRRKIELIAFTMDEINGSMENETKSSLGDKHETSRARMQSELEKLSWQMDELKGQLRQLNKIELQAPTKIITGNPLVTTNQGTFFISIALGKIDFEEQVIFVISPTSPLGKALLGNSLHDTFRVNNFDYQVLSIL